VCSAHDGEGSVARPDDAYRKFFFEGGGGTEGELGSAIGHACSETILEQRCQGGTCFLRVDDLLQRDYPHSQHT
jgi:hypothetical protein